MYRFQLRADTCHVTVILLAKQTRISFPDSHLKDNLIGPCLNGVANSQLHFDISEPSIVSRPIMAIIGF